MSAPRGDSARVTVHVAASPELAFEVFTREIDLWWKRGPKFRHSGRHVGVLHLEPGVGGRIFETFTVGDSPRALEVGQVRVWEPPARLVFGWRNATFAPHESTEVEVQFQAARGGTQVIVEHRGWSTLPKDHPARHGLEGAAFSGMIGMWWGELMTAMRARMDEPAAIAGFWQAVEDDAEWLKRAAAGDESAAVPVDGPEWMRALARARACDLYLRLDAARALLAAADPDVPAGGWRRVWRLLALSLDVRTSAGAALAEHDRRLAQLLDELPAVESSTLRRAWHLRAMVSVRNNDFAAAEAACCRALDHVDASRARAVWILDGFGQALQGQASWEEARRTFDGVIRLKAELGDALGVAITAGNLALLELQLGAPLEAAAALDRALAAPLEPPTRLRLETMLLQARLDAATDGAAAATSDGVAAAASALEGTLALVAGRLQSLSYAAIALGRAAAHLGDLERAGAHFARAEADQSLVEQVALARYWRARLLHDGAPADRAAWRSEMEELFRRAAMVTEAEILTYLLLADEAHAERGGAAAHEWLERAFARATECNNRFWLERVERAHRRIDPDGMADRMIARFSGRSPEELARTVKEDATIVFVDLVSFTPRSQDLAPEEVMRTVRGFFELAVPLLARHRVRPLSCLGDGLLAVAQGEDHRRRGREFARELVARGRRVSTVRRLLGEKWGVEMRAGVNSGPVVLGTLGNLFKLEYAAIGLTTNIAARLQAAADPNQVMCAFVTAEDSAADGSDETLTLKGVTQPVRAIRFRV